MNRTVVVSISAIAVATMACVYLFVSGQRYSVVNAGNGSVYRVDRRTGTAVLLIGANELPVTSLSGSSEGGSPEDRAIRIAKEGHTLKPGDYTRDNDFQISDWIRGQTGDLRVIGWKARRFDAQTSVVTYSIEQGSTARSWAFEVQPQADLVRNVSGDEVLEKKYGLSAR